MTKRSSFSVRGRNALVAIKDPRDLAIVRKQFGRLGVGCHAWQQGESLDLGADLVLIDDDLLPLRLPGDCAVIALLGTETPSRLKLVLDLDPAAFLVKPLRSAGIYAALVLALEARERVSELQQQIAKLDARLRSRRVVLGAVMQVMRTQALDEPAAFDAIRRAAMQRRMTIEDIAAEIVADARLSRAV